MRIKEGKDLIKHLNIFKEILDQLNKVDVKTNEEDKTLLLASLINFYDNFVEIDIMWKRYNNSETS